jgi:uncharacterized coiled-coil DUF342 family protein
MKDGGGRVIGLEAHNIMQLKAVKIDLQGKHVVKISGRNDAGKSTALDLFAIVVGGTALCPAEPISRGEKKGYVVVEMEGYTATRKFWLLKGDVLASKLILTSKNGAEFKSPKTMLDNILGPLTIDPLEFTRKMLKEPKKARDILLKLAGVEIDLDELARDRQVLYDERTRVNRNAKDKNGELAGIELPNPDLLVDEVCIIELTQKYGEASEIKTNNDKIRKDLDAANKDVLHYNDEITVTKNEIVELELAIEDNKRQLSGLQESFKKKSFLRDSLQQQLDGLIDPDFDAIGLKIAEAEETNREIREAQNQQSKRITLKMVIESLHDDSNNLTHDIGELDNQKDGALQGAKFPIHGLSVDETGIRFNGLPLAQGSQSERIKVGLAISAKMNPKASLIRIYEGSSLDSDNMKIIDEFAGENDLTVLMEVVDETGNVGIVIEGGRITKIN